MRFIMVLSISLYSFIHVLFALSFSNMSSSPMRITEHSISHLTSDPVGVLLNLLVLFEFAILIYRSTIARTSFTPDED